MRNVKFKGLVLGLILCLSVSAVFATGNIRINKYGNTNLSIVTVFNPSHNDLKVELYDCNNNIYYANTIAKRTSAQKLFNFKNVENGTYKIVLAGNGTTVVKKFKVIGGKLAVIKKEEKKEKQITTANTLFKNNNNKLFVMVSPGAKKVTVVIKNQKQHKVYQKRFNAEGGFAKKFDISKLPSGNYTVFLKGDNIKHDCDYAFAK